MNKLFVIKDINECQINNHDCLDTQRCDNTIGSYTCIRLQSCGTGYTLNAETGNCDGNYYQSPNFYLFSSNSKCILNKFNWIQVLFIKQ